MKQLRGLYAQTFFTFRKALVFEYELDQQYSEPLLAIHDQYKFNVQSHCWPYTNNTSAMFRATVGLTRPYKCNVQSHCWPYRTNIIFRQTSCPRTNKANNGRQCFGNFYFQARKPITNSTGRRKGASHLCRHKVIEQVNFT